jgi:hypothetical protein
MTRTLKTQALLLTVLLLMSIGVVVIGSKSLVKASPEEAVVYVEPDAILDLMPPENFTIKVKIANVTNLYGIDIQFTWDPTIIKYVTHTKKIPVETYPDGILHTPTIPVRNQVDENASMPGAEPGTRYWLSEASLSPAATFNGDGTIFEMKFQVVGLGTSQLHIVACTLADKDGNSIPHIRHDGYFQNYVPPPPPPPPPANIFVTPPSIVNSSMGPCQNFAVNVTVENVTNLYSFDFWLGYNFSILEVDSVTVNTAFPPPVIIQNAGQIEVSASLSPPTPPISGDLFLASIEFHVLAIGESSLDLHDVILLNNDGENISMNEPRDGYFNNMLITRMFVDPPELIVPTMKLGDIFTIDIALENAVGMYGYEFKLGYDTRILTCLGSVVLPPNNDTNFDVEQSINDPLGVVWVKVQYYPPAEPIDIYTPKAVVRITFMLQAYGQTILDLHDADIVNEFGDSLGPVVEDGFFATLLRDVAIMFVNVTSANKVYPGRNVTIEVVAMNRGNMTEETFNVTVFANSTAIGTQRITLAPWSNVTLSFQWNTSDLTPCSNFTIRAEASLVPYEIDPTDNIFYDGWIKIKMIGDVNGDGLIDILDIVAITIIYAAHEGDKGWNPDADVAAPWGVIDILDLVTVSAKYGSSC